MKRIASIFAATLFAVAGCHSNPPASTSLPTNSSVATLPPPAPIAVAQPAPQPTDYAAAPIDTSTPVQASDVSVGPASSVGGGKYTVKHGDTLYRIAASHYGSGKDWKKIASANPGINPTHLRVGQTLVLP